MLTCWKWTFAAVLLASLAVPPYAVADTIFEVEHARATARAGGPLSDNDLELLDRWGRLSGTPDPRSGPLHVDDRDQRAPPRHGKRRSRLR